MPTPVKTIGALATATTSGTVPSFEEFSYTGTWDVSGSTATSTIYVRKIGNTVQLSVGALFKALGGGASQFVMQAGSYLPSRFRPAVEMKFPVLVTDNGSDVTAPGCIFVFTTGRVDLYKDNTGANFANGAIGGISGAQVGREHGFITYRV